MKALIGLGNPEIKYKTTRHNTGFLIMDEIMRHYNVELSDKFNSFFGKKGDILFLLPKTYMNLSGNAVIELMNFYKLTNKDILDYNLSINIKYVSKNQRIYEFVANGERYEKLLKEFSLDE